MKPAELRIGNYAKNWLIEFGTITAIDSRAKECALFHEKSGTHICDTKRIEPIPLTEEWLVKLGLEMSTDNNGCPHGVLCLKKYGTYSQTLAIAISNTYETNTYISECDSESDVFNSPIKTKYVHQLQNLYFALTQKELTIKE